MSNVFSVGLALAFAEKGGGEFAECFDVAQLPIPALAILDRCRIIGCDTATPILILVQASGRITIADGRHRLAKAYWIERRLDLLAWVLPWSYAAKSAARIQFMNFDNL